MSNDRMHDLDARIAVIESRSPGLLDWVRFRRMAAAASRCTSRACRKAGTPTDACRARCDFEVALIERWFA